MISAQTARRAVWRPLWQLPQRFDLILSLTKRELAARYRGSALGIVWAVLTPIVMIAIFTIIFAGIFGARFGANTSQWDYALYLFCGLLPWNAFQESVQLSASTIVGHANLVKRVVFLPCNEFVSICPGKAMTLGTGDPARTGRLQPDTVAQTLPQAVLTRRFDERGEPGARAR